jgi:hypothetical protein
MHQLLKSPTQAWLALVVITFGIWVLYLLVDKYLMVFAVLLSAVKVIIIGLRYMEVNLAKKEVVRFYFAWIFAVSLLFIASEILG